MIFFLIKIHLYLIMWCFTTQSTSSSYYTHLLWMVLYNFIQFSLFPDTFALAGLAIRLGKRIWARNPSAVMAWWTSLGSKCPQ